MSSEQYFSFLLEDKELVSNWERFFKGKMVLTLQADMVFQYAYFFDKKIYLGNCEADQVEWKEGSKQKVLSMLLDPDVNIKKIKKTDRLIQDIVDKTLTGMDGEYKFETKTKAVWTSEFTGEDQVLEDFELGEIMMSYFTGLHDWVLEKKLESLEI